MAEGKNREKRRKDRADRRLGESLNPWGQMADVRQRPIMPLRRPHVGVSGAWLRESRRKGGARHVRRVDFFYSLRHKDLHLQVWGKWRKRCALRRVPSGTRLGTRPLCRELAPCARTRCGQQGDRGSPAVIGRRSSGSPMRVRTGIEPAAVQGWEGVRSVRERRSRGAPRCVG